MYRVALLADTRNPYTLNGVKVPRCVLSTFQFPVSWTLDSLQLHLKKVLYTA